MKLINKIKNNKDYLFAFLIPLGILLLVFIYLHVFIRNDSVLLVSDAKAQYLSFLVKLKDILTFNASAFYSFEKGIGGNILGTIAYYLVSPINLIVLFFSKASMNGAFITIITLKLSLSGLMMYVFLKYHFKNQNKLYLLIFSTCYALMAYNVGYYFHIMWLDCVYLTPLVMLGIDKIINKKSPLLYGITLFACILTNFYIGYMVCIFSVIYFLYKLLIKYNLKDMRDILSSAINFVIPSLLAGMASAILVIPTIKELMLTSKLTTNIFSLLPLKINLNVFDIISKMYLGSQNFGNILNQKSALIYCGIIIIPLVIFYFLNKAFAKREKILSMLVILIFIISFAINYIAYIWHGFNVPLCFNQRYSFLFSFFLLYLACQSFFKLSHIKKIDYWIAATVFALVSIPVILANYLYCNRYLVYTTLSLYCIYLLLLYLFNSVVHKDKKRTLGKLIMILVFAELFFNFYVSLKDYNYGATKEYDDFNQLVGSEITKIQHTDSNLFYRMEQTIKYTQNDGLYLGYNGINSFISTLNSTVMDFFNNNGYSTFANNYLYQDSNPIVDSILGVKYVMYRNGGNAYYDEISRFKYSSYDGLMYNIKKSDVIVTKNPNNLSLGFMINKSSLNFTQDFIKQSQINKIYFSNILLKTMVNSSLNVFEKVDFATTNEKDYTIKITSHSNIFVFFNNVIKSDTDYILILVNGNYIKAYSSNENNFFIIKNTFKIGEEVKLTASEVGMAKIVPNPAIYYFNKDIYNEQINSLKSNQINIIKMTDTYIKGAVTSTEERSILFTSIPTEPGWTAYVDGKKVEMVELYSAFNGIKLTPGKHIIEFKFYPPGLNLGIAISSISLLMSALFFWKRKKFTKFITDMYIKYEEVIAYLVVGVLTTVVSLLTYIVFAKMLHVDYMTSTVISWIISVLFAYIANKMIVFKSKSKEIIKEMFEFFKYRLLSLAMDLGIMYVLVSWFHVNDILARVIIQVIVIIANYYFSKFFIFKK